MKQWYKEKNFETQNVLFLLSKQIFIYPLGPFIYGMGGNDKKKMKFDQTIWNIDYLLHYKPEGADILK